MEEKQKSFFKAILSMKKSFWIVSFMELMERWAWYGMFGVLGLYLVGSTDQGGLGFNHVEKGKIMSNVTAILYFLPLIFGVIADRIGYKISLAIAFLLMIVGYYFMGEVRSYWGMYLIFLLVAVGAAFFKPVSSAVVARSTDSSTGTLGFGIFYMMVNIGGFVGPAMSSYLRTEFGWKIMFIQASTVIFLNLIILFLFFKEPKIEQKSKKSIFVEIKTSLLNIVEALKDKRLTLLLILMICFWTMFNQLFYTLPNFIEDWVDSSPLSQWINQNIPFLGTLLTQNGQVKPEWFTNIDAMMIVFVQVFVSYFVTKMSHINAMIRGAIIATIGVSLTFFTDNFMYTIIGTMIFAIGEMASSPTLSSFIALITPKGKEGLYQGTYFLPVAAGNYFTGFIAGDLYEKWSDKLSLLQGEMSKRSIAMPKIVSKEEFIEKASSNLHMPLNEFNKQFHINGDTTDWKAVGNSVQNYAQQKGIQLESLNLPFSKNEYFSMAESKLGISHWQLTQYLWDTYQPNKIWYVICAIGLFSVISLWLYNKFLVQPNQKIEQMN